MYSPTRQIIDVLWFSDNQNNSIAWESDGQIYVPVNLGKVFSLFKYVIHFIFMQSMEILTYKREAHVHVDM